MHSFGTWIMDMGYVPRNDSDRRKEEEDRLPKQNNYDVGLK